jgi:hypothetical protein
MIYSIGTIDPMSRDPFLDPSLVVAPSSVIKTTTGISMQLG